MWYLTGVVGYAVGAAVFYAALVATAQSELVEENEIIRLTVAEWASGRSRGEQRKVA